MSETTKTEQVLTGAEPVVPVRKKLKKADILAAKDIKEKWVYVKEWDGDVLLVEMNADEALKYVQIYSDPLVQLKEGMTRIVCLCLRDPDTRERMFESPEDVEAFRKKNAKIFRQLQDECLKLNGFTAEEVAEVKNDSGEADTAASPTA